MAYLGRLETTIQDSSGNAVGGVSVEVRKRGAICNGGSGGSTTNHPVFDPGGIIVGDSVQLNGSGTSYPVTAVTATQITTSDPFASTNLAVLSPSTSANFPTLYVDSTGTTTKSNPLTTATSGQVGMAFAYVKGGQYDAYVSGGTPAITSTLLKDLLVGGDNHLSVEMAAPTFTFDTLRTVVSADKVFSIKNAGTERWYVKGDGKQGATTFEGALTISSGGVTVTASGVTISAGGLLVLSGGADIEGDTTLRDSLLIGPIGLVDCNLYRTSANVLKTDDSLIIAANLTLTGYTLLTVPTEITVSSATLTLPAAGTAFVVTAASPQTVTTISGATSGQLLLFSAKAASSDITFSGANFVHSAGNAILGPITSATVSGGLIYWFDGSVFRLMANIAT